MRKKRRVRKRKQRVKPQQDETVNTTAGANQAQPELDRLPEHFTARPANGVAILQMQQQYGNVHVQHWINTLISPNSLQRQNEITSSEDTLQRGSQGLDVKQTQEALLQAGYSLGRYGADGIFGRVTERAVHRFQHDHGLQITGIVDAQTKIALTQTTPTIPTQEGEVENDTLPRADLGPRERGRAFMLDWNARHQNIAQDVTLREAFLENLELQISTIFGEVLTQAEVLQKIERAEATGDSAMAGHLLTQLRIANQYALVETLKVEQSERYRKRTREVNGRTKTSTYCNIYAYDVVTALGGYLPRVWWKRGALARLQRGEEVEPVYGRTVHELNANALTEWMFTHGGEFGWQQAVGITTAQEKANQGKLVIILAANANPRRSGHVTILMPETEQHQAERSESGEVSAPLQSQAGSRNFRYETNFKRRRRQWWENSRHERGAAWIFEGLSSSPLLSPEQLGYRS